MLRLVILHCPFQYTTERSTLFSSQSHHRVFAYLHSLSARLLQVLDSCSTKTRGTGSMSICMDWISGHSFGKSSMSIGAVLNPATAKIKNFTQFPRLPTELRLKIWGQARTVRILTINSVPGDSVKFACSQSAPILLSVCRESRYEMLRFYHLISDHAGHEFYFNPYCDTLFLDASIATEWIRILHSIEDSLGPEAKVLSLALKNVNRCPHTFAIEAVSGKGVKEIFIIGQFEGRWVPDIWTLFPRHESSIRHHRSIVEAIENWECMDERLPSVVAVKEDLWRRQGISLIGKW